MPHALKILVYPAFGVTTLLIFILVLFPYDSVRSRVAREVEGLLGGAYEISIGGLTPLPPTGLILKDLEVRPRGTEDGASAKIARARFSFAPLSLIRRNLDLDFAVEAGKGEVKGSVQMEGEGAVVSVRLDQFALSTVPFAVEELGIPLDGILSGKIALELYPRDPLRNAGTVSLELQELLLRGGNVEGFLELPRVRLSGATRGASRLEMEVTRGNWEVKELILAEGDLECTASGKIYAARRLKNYRFNLKGDVKISQALMESFPLLTALEGQKSEQGTYPVTITGRVARPRVRIGDFKLPI